MLVFASPIPSAFAGFGSLQPRSVPRPSPEEQYFLTLAEEHERAASFARQRLQQVQVVRKQQHDAMEAQLRLQQQLAASLQVRTPQRSPYQTPARHQFARALPDSNVILEFDADDRESCDVYAERMHRRTQERQKRADEQAILRALFEEQRRAQAKRVAELHKQRVEEAKAQREAEEKQARQHLEARAAEEEKLRQFFQALNSAMNAQAQTEGADLGRKNAIRRNSAPVSAPVETTAPAPAPVPASAPVSPKAPVRSSSPAPSTSSDASDASLHSIAHLQEKYDSLRAGFTLPSNLIFAPSSSSPAASPSLLYNPTNAPVHAYEHALTGLLTELDAVESFGDEHVRDVRRTLARTVEAELEALEEKKRDAWRKQKNTAPVAEPTPAPAPVEVEATPAVESTPAVVAEPAPAPAAPATLETASPLAWLAARLSQESHLEEDIELKAVRESLLARLAPLAPAFEPAPAPEPTAEPAPVVESTKPAPVEKSTDSAPAEQSVEVAPAAEPSEPTPVAEEPAVTPEPVEEPVTVEAVTPEPESAPAESEPASVESESAPVEAAAAATTTPESESEPAAIETEAAGTHTPTESVAAPELSTEAEPTVTAAEPEPTPAVEPAPVVESAPVTDSAPAPVPAPEAELESVSSTSELEIVAPVPETIEPTTFVQVFPESESDSDAETDADLVSELADRKSSNGGDEFEML